MGTREQELLAAAQSRAAVDAVHRQPPVQGGTAPAGRGQGHVLHDARRPPDPRRHRRPVGGERRSLPQADRRGDQEAGGELDYATAVPDAQPGRVRARERLVADRAQGHRPRVLHELRLRGGRHGAQDRARLPPRARRRHARAADRPRARLSRRRLRRHLRRRHGRQPQGVRGQLLPAVDHLRAHARPGERTRSRAASRSTARISPTISSAWSRCTTRRTSPRSSSSRSPARPACCSRRRAICSGCARSATSTASC